jgi:AbrB family looped-hinge helix DNA binding protein
MEKYAAIIEGDIPLLLRKVTSGGRVTIPKEVPDHLKLNPGDQVDIVRDRAGRYHLKKVVRSLSR